MVFILSVKVPLQKSFGQSLQTLDCCNALLDLLFDLGS